MPLLIPFPWRYDSTNLRRQQIDFLYVDVAILCFVEYHGDSYLLYHEHSARNEEEDVEDGTMHDEKHIESYVEEMSPLK